ncbi:MAG: Smr/MutS family protein [Spirochaetota bacterium]
MDDRAVFESYLAEHPVLPKHEPVEPTRSRAIKPGDVKNARPKDTIDLHGMISRDAASALSRFLTGAVRSGASPVLIIHGKGLHSGGIGVIKKLVLDELSHRYAEHVLTFTPAPARLGGGGATLVWLKRNK